MARDSKKHLKQSVITQELRKQEPHIKLSPLVAVNPTATDYSQELIVFNFTDYNDGLCEICNLQKQDARKMTTQLKKDGDNTVASFKDRHKGHRIKGAGHYQRYFNGLGDDVEMYEIKFADTGRVFGRLLGNVFRIIAIVRTHTETNKNFR